MSILCLLGFHTTRHPDIKWNPERLECHRCGKTLVYDPHDNESDS